MSHEVYEFGLDFQTLILAFALKSVEFNVRVDGLLKPEYFESETFSVLASIAVDYYTKYKTVPTTPVLMSLIKDAIDKKMVRDELKDELKDTLRDIFVLPLTDIDYTVEKVASFARRQELTAAILKSVHHIERGEYDMVEPLIQKAVMVGENKDAGQYDFFAEADNRYAYREEVLSGRIKPTGITTGSKKIDNLLYHKGWGRKELSVVMAPAKGGKSMSLVGFAVAAALGGYNVLFVSLEVSTKIVSDRLDANLAGVELNNLAMQMRKTRDAAKMVAATTGELKVHDFASGTLTPTELRRLIHRYKATGTNFDLVVVDYADLMAPDREVDELRENSRKIYLGLRALAYEFDCAVLSATQTNREGFKAKLGEMHHVAEDINKARTVDLLLSLNSESPEVATISFAASRNQGAHTIKVNRNLAMARFIDGILEIDGKTI